MREAEKLAYRSPFPPGFRQLRQERASVRLEGVPQILPQVHALLSRGCEHLLTEELIAANARQITAAQREIRRRAGLSDRTGNLEL